MVLKEFRVYGFEVLGIYGFGSCLFIVQDRKTSVESALPGISEASPDCISCADMETSTYCCSLDLHPLTLRGIRWYDLEGAECCHVEV